MLKKKPLASVDNIPNRTIDGDVNRNTDAAPPVLEARSLRYVARDGSCLIDDVSLRMQRGDVLAIVGPNGAGKSTLLTLLCGLQTPTAGEVILNNKPLSSFSAGELARYRALVGQLDQPDLRLTVEEYVTLGRLPLLNLVDASAHQRAVDQALDVTQTSPLRRAALYRLSGGERQRIQIARALAQEPSLLCLDEPTNHLDPDAKAQMLSLVAELGISVVMVVHDLALVPEFASHLAILEQSRLRAIGAVADVLKPALIREVFGVDFIRLPHPQEARLLSIVDIHRRVPDTLPAC